MDAVKIKPYYKKCFVCGPENTSGLQLDIRSGDDCAYCKWKAGETFAGIEGILHGGILAAVCDDMMAHALYRRGLDTMTAHLEIDYRSPARIGDLLDFEVHVESHREGSRAWHMAGTVTREGNLLAQARGVVVSVEGGPVAAEVKQSLPAVSAEN